MKCGKCGCNIRKFKTINRQYCFYLFYDNYYEYYENNKYYNSYCKDVISIYDVFICKKCNIGISKNVIKVPKYIPIEQSKSWLLIKLTK